MSSLMHLPRTLACVVLLCFFTATVSAQKYNSSLQIDARRSEYFSLQETLWRDLDKPRISKHIKLRKVYEEHRQFNNEYLEPSLAAGKYDILNYPGWSLLERDLLEIDGIFQFYKNYLTKQNSSAELEERAVLDICNAVLRNDKTFSMSRIFQDMELIVTKQVLYYRAMTVATDENCEIQQSPQQFVHSLYTDVALTELKGYTMMQFSWMMLSAYDKGNFTQEAELMRSDYEKRSERILKILREIILRADLSIWRCDPNKHVHNQTYDEVTRLLQGYIENEVDMNKDATCREDCRYYDNATSEGCFKELYCAKQPRCSGNIIRCTFVDSDMWVCPAKPNSIRRYEYIEYESGRILGKKVPCSRGTTKVESWWRYLFWHCSYCFCLCDEMNQKSDRYFNLRETISDFKNNKVVVGLRFVKKNRVFHLQIQEGELQPRGAIKTSSLTWKPVEQYNIFDRDVRNGVDFYTLSAGNCTFDLDDIYPNDSSFIVIGVRINVLGVHLHLEALFAEFDFETGTLKQPEKNMYWEYNTNTDKSGKLRRKMDVSNSDIPTRLIVKSLPDSQHNDYIEFVNTGMDQDAAQTTVPFIDIQDVISNPPIPLSGIGIYHKGRQGYGGFLAPKIMTYNLTQHFKMFKKS